MPCTKIVTRVHGRLQSRIADGACVEPLLTDGIAMILRGVRFRAWAPLIVALFAAGGASVVAAQTPVLDLSGRWTSQQLDYVLDVTRCGAEWCGIKLNADRSCGALVLRLAQPTPPSRQPWLVGTLSLDPATLKYKVSATVSSESGSSEMMLIGNPDGPPQLGSRTIQFHDKLVRGPDAVCRPEGKVS